MKINLIKALSALLIVTTSLMTTEVLAKQRPTTTDTTLETKQTLEQIVTSAERVLLNANSFELPQYPSRYSWSQISGPRVKILNRYDSLAYITAPRLSKEEAARIILRLIVSDELGYTFQYDTNVWVLPPQPKEPPVLVPGRTDNEFIIPGSYHPLGNELVAVLNFPEGASAQNPVPGCAIVHGSGGLFRENEANEDCSDELESTYQNLNDQLNAAGVATILPSSFYSRNSKFCEDNSDEFIQHAPSPFFNGNDPVARDDSYKIRRVAIRTMDMLATMNFFCDLEEVDCSKSCMVGTSNGATSILGYSAQSLPKDLLEFMDDEKRPFEYNSTHQKRNTAFANFPNLTISPITLKYNLTHRPLPNFAQLVSPGCTMRDMVPDIEPDAEVLPFGLDELYYPAGTTELTFEVGTLDNVPSECYTAAPNGDGLREIQARHFEQNSGIAANDSRYLIEVHQNADHGLLQDDAFSEEILDRLDVLVNGHLFP